MNSRHLVLCVVVALALGAAPAASSGAAQSVMAASTALPVPNPVYGVTLDCGYVHGVDGNPGVIKLYAHLPAILASLRHLSKKPTVRVVFDEYARPVEYIPALRELRSVAYIMGELLDSSHMADFNTARYRARAQTYFDALGGLVDIWEIGNEVNGDWTMPQNTAENREVVGQSIAAAYDLAHARGFITALTLYREAGESPPNEMFRWVSDNLPARVQTGVDYALVSYYDNDLSINWKPIFGRLGTTFPQANVGFGEMGGDDSRSNGKWTLEHYYGMNIPLPNYIGGYFYWYYCTQMLPYQGNDLWNTLDHRFGYLGMLVSQGQPARASSIESPSFAARNAVDGNPTTRWASARGHDPEWLQVDLGATLPVVQVDLWWAAAFASKYEIQTSIDGERWTTIYATTSGHGGAEDITGLSGSGRYLRMYGIKRGIPELHRGYSLDEMHVYGT